MAALGEDIEWIAERVFTAVAGAAVGLVFWRYRVALSQPPAASAVSPPER